MLKSLEAVSQYRHKDAVAFSHGKRALSYKDLYAAIASVSRSFDDQTNIIAIIARNSLDWVLVDLAVAACGKTFIPLPIFFSASQIEHIIQEANIDLVLFDPEYEALIDRLDTPRRELAPYIADARAQETSMAGALWDPQSGGKRIIYTSGTTGTPKGVLLGEEQLNFTLSTLAQNIEASAQDVYLSVLPFALLLEEICGIHIPLFVGGRCVIDTVATEATAAGDLGALQGAAAQARPSVMVLVPELLRAWTAYLLLNGEKAPASLRFVAVGGARVAPELMEHADRVGLPAFEGYGLSECGSVVALNTPDQAKAGTSGQPLAGLNVEIIEGEITVSGPNVMDGYLGRTPHQGRLHTGDLGHIDENGFLIVAGRKDSVLVNGYGRNVSPEWIESLYMSDFRIARAVLTQTPDASFCLLIIPTALGESLYEASQSSDTLKSLVAQCAPAPHYAHPTSFIALSREDAAQADLFTDSGRPKRTRIAQFVSTQTPLR